MTALIFKIKILTLFCALNLFNITQVALAGEVKDTGNAGAHEVKIEIKNFAFNPQTINVKSGEQITWINRDEEPHTIVSVEKQFKKSTALDTDQQFTITAGAPGTYTYFCSVHPKMTGTIVIEKS
jgi:plastocyanin